MHSRTPKVLHDLCGIPMLLWPVRAAREAGAERVIVVDSPARALEPVLPDGVRAGDPADGERNRRGGQRRDGGPRRLARPISRALVVILSGDVPLVSAAAIAELVGAHEASGAAATMASTVLEDPAATAAWCAPPTAPWSGSSRPSAPATPARPSSRSGRSTPASSPSRRRPCYEALPQLTADNAQGELYLPQVLDAAEGRRRADRGEHRARTTAWCWESTTAWPSRGCESSPRPRSTSATCSPGSRSSTPTPPSSTSTWRSARTRWSSPSRRSAGPPASAASARSGTPT